MKGQQKAIFNCPASLGRETQTKADGQSGVGRTLIGWLTFTRSCKFKIFCSTQFFGKLNISALLICAWVWVWFAGSFSFRFRIPVSFWCSFPCRLVLGVGCASVSVFVSVRVATANTSPASWLVDVDVAAVTVVAVVASILASFVYLWVDVVAAAALVRVEDWPVVTTALDLAPDGMTILAPPVSAAPAFVSVAAMATRLWFSCSCSCSWSWNWLGLSVGTDSSFCTKKISNIFVSNHLLKFNYNLAVCESDS